MTFTEPYMRVRFWVLTRSDSGIKTAADLKGRVLAHTSGSLYSAIVERSLPGARGLRVPSAGEAVQALCESRAEAALVAQGASDPGVVRTAGCPAAGLRMVPVPGGMLNFGIASKKFDSVAEKAAEQLQHEIVQLFDEGVLAGIWLKWGLPSTETRMLADYVAARRYSRWLAALVALLLIALMAAIWLTLRWRAAQQAANSAAQAKASFLANMSHEIRTPMNGVLGVASLLSSTKLSGEQREYVSLIQGSAATLLRLLNDVLEVVKTESGSLSLQLGPFDLYELSRETILLLKPQAHAKGLAVEFDWAEGLPLFWFGDGVRVSQILNNLLGNAIKYTRQGSVGLKIEADGKGVCLHIRDTGEGLPEELRAGDFEKFTRGRDHEAAGIEGTGLGLFICSRLVKLMGGSIEVTTNARGTEFRVRLPLKPAAAADMPVSVSDAHLHLADAGARKVLLVEDNRVNQLVASRMLMKLGCSVTIASSGESALEKVRCDHFDVVFMDCRLPGMDGFATASHIRANQGNRPRVPIVALTASAYESDRKRCFDAGMDDHIGKPIDLTALQKALSKWATPARESALKP